jgi:hypothetical protein
MLIPLGILAGQITAPLDFFFLARYGSVGLDESLAIKTNDDDDVFSAGYIVDANQRICVIKRDVFGALQWQRGINFSSQNTVARAIDSFGTNVYLSGDGRGSARFVLMTTKYNSSGTLQWQRGLESTITNRQSRGRGIAVDSAENVYSVGTSADSAGTNFGLIAKYDSSGTLQWQRSLSVTDGVEFLDVALDSSQDVYAVGTIRFSGTRFLDGLVAKYNSSGTIQWQRRLGGDGGGAFSQIDTFRSIAIDNSDNIYVCGETGQFGGATNFLVAKYNSSGTLQWQRSIGTAAEERAEGVSTDADGNLYVTGFTSTSPRQIFTIKMDSAGNIVWVRELGGSGNEEGFSVAVNSKGSLHINGTTTTSTAGSSDWFSAKVPNDGSLTGTYVLAGQNVSYSVASRTATALALTDAAGGATAATSSLTALTTSGIGYTPTLTSDATLIG